MKTFTGIEELQQAVGTHLGHSEWHSVEQHHINSFAEATGDHQWIHVDVERAKSGPFRTTIAHGYLTLALVPMMVWEVYTVGGITTGLNYGTNKTRFPAPVPVGSRLRAGVELVSVDPRSDGCRVIDRVTIELEGSAKPACVVETVRLLLP